MYLLILIDYSTKNKIVDKRLDKNISYKNKKPQLQLVEVSFCSSSWARTKDPLINSQML